jgi:hypothetical protein
MVEELLEGGREAFGDVTHSHDHLKAAGPGRRESCVAEKVE